MTRIVFTIAILFSLPVIGSDYIRVSKDNDELVSLDTSITTYESKDGKVTIDLIGVVHVGERRYYKEFDKHFDKCDVVLYELVGPKGSKPQKKESSEMGVIQLLQDTMKDVLQLEHQLEIVDYNRANFLHADLSVEEIKKLMDEEGETPLTIGLGVARDMIRSNNLKQEQEKAPDIDMVKLVFGQDTQEALKLKRFMAKQMVGQVNSKHVTGMETLEKLLIQDRNKKVLTILQEQVKMGKNRIGIFYGAGHMRDFNEKLKSMDFKQTSVVWVKAWNLR